MHQDPGVSASKHSGSNSRIRNNRVTLHPSARDQWDNPLAGFNVTYGDNERVMLQEARRDAIAMLEAAGCMNIRASGFELTKPGNRIHEMGGARMDRDPATSVLNGWCQAHDIENLFVTDGSFMVSAACQNPSLTYMAFNARAANSAADLLADGTLHGRDRRRWSYRGGPSPPSECFAA